MIGVAFHVALCLNVTSTATDDYEVSIPVGPTLLAIPPRQDLNNSSYLKVYCLPANQAIRSAVGVYAGWMSHRVIGFEPSASRTI